MIDYMIEDIGALQNLKASLVHESGGLRSRRVLGSRRMKQLSEDQIKGICWVYASRIIALLEGRTVRLQK